MPDGSDEKMPVCLRVLIAEDDPVYASLLEGMLLAEEHDVCGIVREGRAVPEAVRRLKPDVVLMDLHLEDGLSGVAATRELLRLVSVPVIIVSGTDNPEDLEAVAGSGALGFIKKPVSVDALRVNLRLAAARNEMMKKLSESELFYRNLFDNAAVGIYICGTDGRFVACNRTYAGMLGYGSPAELSQLIVSMDEQVYVEEGRRGNLLEQLDRFGELRDMESQLYGRDGDTLWVSEYLTVAHEENGEMTHYQGVVINISDRVRAENDRNLAYSLVQTTMDAIADFVAATDLDGNIIIGNRAFERELGSVLAGERVLRFEGPVATALEEFKNESVQQEACWLNIRGVCRVAGYGEALDVGVSRFCTTEGEVVGAVFVMRPVRDS